MVQGFVTIATGDERYYKMARNLLRSYRQNCPNPKPFAIIADRQNRYTEEFDQTVLLSDAKKSWMDKLQLLKVCPYDESIFIDADCIAYRDLNVLWEVFDGADDFSCFGQVLPMDAPNGWFTKQAAEVYPIHFITHLHGIVYFLRKSSTLEKMSQLCEDIIRNYRKISFKYFNDRLADEPVFALAMAILDCKPRVRDAKHYCFVPFATWYSADYYTRNVKYIYPGDDMVEDCYIVHWGNVNTMTAPYRNDEYYINLLHKNPNAPKGAASLRNFWYRVRDSLRKVTDKISWFTERLINKVGSIFRK